MSVSTEILPEDNVAPSKHNLRYVLWLICISALGGLLLGWDTSVISGAIGLSVITSNCRPHKWVGRHPVWWWAVLPAPSWQALSPFAGAVKAPCLPVLSFSLFQQSALPSPLISRSTLSSVSSAAGQSGLLVSSVRCTCLKFRRVLPWPCGELLPTIGDHWSNRHFLH